MARHCVGVAILRSTKLAKIASIEKIEKESYVFDPCCESPHAYVANGVVNHNCILWIDEIEKGLGGVQSSNQTDGGVTNRIFGTMLTWMQEKECPVFVVCTANNIMAIPPEFMRAGRFDEIFFLDLPDDEQRLDVLTRLLVKKKRNPADFDLYPVVQASVNYSPAELEKAINNALFVAFSDNKRKLTTQDLISEISKFQPLYNSRREEIEAMREWALGKDQEGGRAVLANSSNKIAGDFSTFNTSRSMNLSEDDL